MDTFIRIFLPTFFVVYFSAAFIWPTYRTYRQTGVNPVTFGGADNAHDFIGKWFKLLMLFLSVVIAIFLAGPEPYAYLLPVSYLQLPWVPAIGICACLLSLSWTIIAQAQMGAPWRIGLDHQNKTPLIRKGLFSLSRNPVFLGMIVTLAGVFFIIPNALTFLTAVAGYLLMQIQVRLEEEFLETQHGEEYAAFRREVRRWL